MIYKNFRLNVLLRIILIASGIGASIYCYFILGNYIRTFFSLIFTVIVIIDLLRYIEKINFDLETFLNALLHDDYSLYFSKKKKGKSFQKIYGLFNKITAKYYKMRTEKELNHIYLQTIIDQIKIGILSFNDDGKVFLINNAFKAFLDIRSLTFIEGISGKNEEFLKIIRTIAPSEHKLIKIVKNGQLIPLSISSISFKLQNEKYKLISVQNIKSELEENELDAWQKLIRVLTHEIMNSVTPITSLTSSLFNLLPESKPDQPEDEQKRNRYLHDGLDAIHERSKGLLSFTRDYQKLTKMPQPIFNKIDLAAYFKRVELLLKPQFDQFNISFKLIVKPEIKYFIADPQLMEQVFINLLNNAIDAVKSKPDPRIEIEVNKSYEGKILISVKDNGTGIPKNHLDNIFVPFYTTKESGSGIGLSLSKQIISMHKGTIDVVSVEDKGTVFNIKM